MSRWSIQRLQAMILNISGKHVSDPIRTICETYIDCANPRLDLPAHPEHFNPVAGLHIRKADMTDYNRSRHPLDRKQLTFYTLRGSLPPLVPN